MSNFKSLVNLELFKDVSENDIELITTNDRIINITQRYYEAWEASVRNIGGLCKNWLNLEYIYKQGWRDVAANIQATLAIKIKYAKENLTFDELSLQVNKRTKDEVQQLLNNWKKVNPTTPALDPHPHPRSGEVAVEIA